MTKEIKANWYTPSRYRKYHPPLKVEFANGESEYVYRGLEKSEDGTLFSSGRYKTSIRPEDLPSWYMIAWTYGRTGWINVDNITDIYYVPNKWINHLFRDDFIYVKFGGKLEFEDDTDKHKYVKNYDMIVSGHDIIELLAYLTLYKKNSGLPIEDIKEQVEDKVVYYEKNFSEEHDAISLDEYKRIYNLCYQDAVESKYEYENNRRNQK